MKRALAYVVTGIMLGIAVMFIPLMMFIPSGVQLSVDTLTDSARTLGTEEYKGAAGAPSETKQTLGVGGGVTLPLSLLYVGMIFAISLLSALGVYGLFKRRMMS